MYHSEIYFELFVPNAINDTFSPAQDVLQLFIER